MIRRRFLGWFGSLLGIGAAETVIHYPIADVTNFTSGGWQEVTDGADAKTIAKRAEIEAADSIKVKCGTLEILCPNGVGKNTTVLIDGREVSAKSIALRIDVRGVAVATIEYFPCIGLYGPEKPCPS